MNDLTIFAAVAEAGGFTAAAQRLNVAPAKISIEIARLETQLATALFTRTTRKVALTESGRGLYQRCAPLLRELSGALEEIHAPQRELSGALRITAPVDHGVHSLAPALARFAALHPSLQLELRTSDRISDLVAEGIDVAIRMGWLRDSSQRAVKLGEFDQYVVAAPARLGRGRRPRVPEDLLKLDWVALTLLPTPLTWKFTSAKGESRTIHFKSRIKADSAGALRALVRHGAGAAVLDQFSVQADLQSGSLVRLLPDWAIASGGIYAVLPPGRHVSPKAQAFIAFYRDFLRRPSEN